MDCLSGPSGHSSCYFYSTTPQPLSFSWIHGQRPDWNSELQLVHCLDVHTHTHDPEWMLLSLYTPKDYFSFPLKYRLSSGSQPADFSRRCCWTAVSCCTRTQNHPTDKENTSSRVYHTGARGYHQNLLREEDKEISTQMLSYTVSSLGKGKITLAEHCAATPLHGGISVCKAYFPSYKKRV